MQSCLRLKCTLKNGNGDLDKVISLTVDTFYWLFLCSSHTQALGQVPLVHMK